MFKEYLLNKLSANFESKIMILDYEKISSRCDYLEWLKELGFRIIFYNDIEEFRLEYETNIKTNSEKIAVVLFEELFISYDIRESFYVVSIGFIELFERLNRGILKKENSLDLELLFLAYNDCFGDFESEDSTTKFIQVNMYSKIYVQNYVEFLAAKIQAILDNAVENYNSWVRIAVLKSKIEYLSTKVDIKINFTPLHSKFEQYILTDFKLLSGITSTESPIMVNNIIEFISRNSQKFAVVVLDGMSLFDFYIIKQKFQNIDFDCDYIYAMIPTTTVISRQCLLSGKFPVQLERPFDLSREEREFIGKAKEIGFSDNQISYQRGYDTKLNPTIKCLSVIINDIDDLVHSQMQGRKGMLNDIELLANSNKIQDLIKALHKSGYDTFLTSDHGNTNCIGVGSLKGLGVEVETKSKRMIVLKDIGQTSQIKEINDLIDYPGYYLDKSYKYLICKAENSFDNKGTEVMTHGGITIDEVIVPFIKIKDVQNG